MKVSPSEHGEYQDRVTGVRIHQMTAHPSINHGTYFLQSSFSPDGSTLLFTSYRDSTAQLYEAGFPDGEIRQLTEGPGAVHPFSAAFHPSGESVYFVRGSDIVSINRRT